MNRSIARRLGVVALNTWIVFHFFSICTAPASIPPSTDIARSAWTCCSGYLQLLYLNHAYHFFAPEPGGSTLIAYEATSQDGRVEWSRIPNREQFPRLRYHRHFVLTDHASAVLQARPDLKPMLSKSFALHLASKHNASEVVLSEVQHELSTPQQFRSGRAIDDPITYSENWLGEFKWEQPGE